jgi:glycosyltransferase involved in cell wall biosynthesis
VALASESPRVLVVLPCYNEERNIGGVLEEIAALPVAYDTLVIDDGSSDATYRVASAKSNAVRLPVNLGIGGCFQTGIRYAYEKDYDYCVQVDGDGQHPPSEIARLFEARYASGANIVVGSRFSGDSSFRSTRMRRLGIGLISFSLKAVFGHRISDPTSGFRLLDRKALALFARDYPQDFPEPISLAVAMRNGLVVQETGVAMRSRMHGRSSILGLKTAAYVLRVLSYIGLAKMAPRRRDGRI